MMNSDGQYLTNFVVNYVVKLLQCSWAGWFYYFKVVGIFQIVKPLSNVVGYQAVKLL